MQGCDQMSYFKKIGDDVVLTLEGRKALQRLGLDTSDLKHMSQKELVDYVKDVSDPLWDGTLYEGKRGFNKLASRRGSTFTGPTITTHRESSGNSTFGSFSRFFDLDVWFAHRIGDLPEEVQRVFPNLLVSKASAREKNAGLEGMSKKAKPLMGEFKNNPGRKTPKSSYVPRENHHPTVKPVSLLAYLTVLGSRPGDIVLDPFSGSGTTGVACALLGRHFVGCELDPEFIKIADHRITHAQEVRNDFPKVDIKKAVKSLGKPPTGMRRLKKS